MGMCSSISNPCFLEDFFQRVLYISNGTDLMKQPCGDVKCLSVVMIINCNFASIFFIQYRKWCTCKFCCYNLHNMKVYVYRICKVQTWFFQIKKKVYYMKSCFSSSSFCVFLLEKGCRVLVSVLRCFRVECPVETEPGVKFSECHMANQHSPTTTYWGGCWWVLSDHTPSRNRSDCYLASVLVLTCTEVWPQIDLACPV